MTTSVQLDIGGRVVGGNSSTFVIAEAGCNHENQFERAKEMISAAAAAGADAVKFQSFTADNIVTRDAPKFWDIVGPGETQYDEFAQIQPQFTAGQYRELFRLSEEHGILFASTPSDEGWVDFLAELGVTFFKVASMDITHLPLLRHIASKGKPIILSTGGSYADEIHSAVNAVRDAGCDQIALLHCVSTYPTSLDQVNLGMMRDLQQRFAQCVVGYSDHTVPGQFPRVPSVAVAMDAAVIEKHFTFDQSRNGYDHEISADYAELAAMVREFRLIEAMRGGSVKEPTEAEERTRVFGRRSVVAMCAISAGTEITADMLAVKRPGTGIEPKYINALIGRHAATDIRFDQVLTWDVLR